MPPFSGFNMFQTDSLHISELFNPGELRFPESCQCALKKGHGAADGVHRQERDHHHLELQVTRLDLDIEQKKKWLQSLAPELVVTGTFKNHQHCRDLINGFCWDLIYLNMIKYVHNGSTYWLVVTGTFFYFSICWECHHPNCYSLHHFSEGQVNHQPVPKSWPLFWRPAKGARFGNQVTWVTLWTLYLVANYPRIVSGCKWVITLVINGISMDKYRVNPLIIGVITHLLFVGWATK